MRKSMICAVAFLALSFLVGLFGPFAGPAPASAQDYVLEMGSVVPPGSPWALQLKRLKKYVEEETGGRVKVKLRLGSSNERSLARRTQMGSKQGFAGSVGGLSSIVREVNVLEAPYLFETVEQADKALDDPAVLKQVRAILKKQKLVFALWGENGFRSYFSRRPIRSPDDMKGIRYRSQEALAHVAAYKALGASPVTIDVANTMTSLQTGVVDGFDNTPLFAMATTWYQGLDDDERNLFLSVPLATLVPAGHRRLLEEVVRHAAPRHSEGSREPPLRRPYRLGSRASPQDGANSTEEPSPLRLRHPRPQPGGAPEVQGPRKGRSGCSGEGRWPGRPEAAQGSSSRAGQVAAQSPPQPVLGGVPVNVDPSPGILLGGRPPMPGLR